MIQLDEKIVDIFPEYVPEKTEGYLGDVTLENMLTMTTGLESSLFFCDWPERYTTPDWIRYFFENDFLNHWELEIRTGLCVRKVMYMLRMVFM